jgi:hypothetical protein
LKIGELSPCLPSAFQTELVKSQVTSFDRTLPA